MGKFTATIATALIYPETPEEKSAIIITNLAVLEIVEDILLIFIGKIPEKFEIEIHSVPLGIPFN